MADTVTINANSPTTAVVSTDEITIDATAQHLQRMKIGIGANNAWDGDLDFGQAAGSASLPVVIANDQDFIKSEDAAHTTGDKGIMSLAVRSDTIGAKATTDGDYIPLTTDSDGRVYISTAYELGAAATGNITANGQTVVATLGGHYGMVNVTYSAVGVGAVIAYEVSYDGASTYKTAVGQYLGASSTPTRPTMYAGISPDTTSTIQVDTLGATHFRIRATSFSSGTLTTRIVPSPERLMVYTPIGDSTVTIPVSIAATVTVTGNNGSGADGFAHPGTAVNVNNYLHYYNGSTWDRGRGNATNGLKVYSGTAAGDLGKAEDALAASGDTGIAMLAVRDDAISSDAADGDYTFIKTNSAGELQVGGVAHDATDAGNPVKIGTQARATDPTAVASGDRVNLLADVLGKLITQPYAIGPSQWQYAAASAGETGTSNVALKAAGGGSVRNYITSFDVINVHATVDTEVVIKDGTTEIWRGFCKAGGGGYSVTLPTPLKGTANTAMNFANVTTGAKTYMNARGYQAID